MSEEVCQSEIQARTQQLLSGPLKHIRAAALAAALLPLASVAAAPASAQDACPSGGAVCGTVFTDVNGNGIQDAGDTPLAEVKVTVCVVCDGSDTVEAWTNEFGFYEFDVVTVPPGNNTISVLIPTGMEVTDPNVCCNDAVDSDGLPSGPFSSVTVPQSESGFETDFGFSTSEVVGPGTGTPGYWKNHPEAWPVQTITVGGVVYSKADAIYWLGKVGKDKRTTMFSSLVPAMLNVLVGNANCVANEIGWANDWMASYGPLDRNAPGVPVSGSSDAWKIGEPWHQTLDAYNNGLLCAPHRQ